MDSKFEIFNGDCLDVMSDMISSGVTVDAIITDPPYGTTGCKWDAVIPYEEMWNRIMRIRKDMAPVVLFGSEPFSSFLRISNIKEFKYDWIWNKKLAGNFMLGEYQPQKIHETISVFFKHNYYPIKIYREEARIMKNNGTGEAVGGIKKQYSGVKKNWVYPKSILEIGNTNRKIIKHPTQKPVSLIGYLIETYTRKNDIVMDFTMGSGTTGVACGNLDRRFIGVEIDSQYFNIAKKRISEAYHKLEI